MLRKLKLYGELAEFVGHKEFEIQANDMTRVTSFLLNNFEGVEEHMNYRYYQVKVGNYTIDKTEILDPIGEEDIHIVPVIAGAGGIARGLLGAIFIGVAIASGGAGFAFGKGGIGFLATGTAPSAFMAAIGNVGIALAIGGIAQMLTPTPEAPTESPSAAFAFGSIQNTSRAGLPVPIVYGEIVVGSLVISAGLDVEAVKV